MYHSKGRGILEGEDFEVLHEEPPVVYAQLELLRIRLRAVGEKYTLLSEGTCLREGEIFWEGAEGLWKDKAKSGDQQTIYFDAISKSKGQIEWNTMSVSGGTFFEERHIVFREITSMRGTEKAKDLCSCAILDEDISGYISPSMLSFAQWNIQAHTLKIFFERPEFGKIHTLDLREAKIEAEELMQVLSSSWHAPNLQHITLDKVAITHALFREACPNLLSLSLRASTSCQNIHNTGHRSGTCCVAAPQRKK